MRTFIRDDEELFLFDKPIDESSIPLKKLNFHQHHVISSVKINENVHINEHSTSTKINNISIDCPKLKSVPQKKNLKMLEKIMKN